MTTRETVIGVAVGVALVATVVWYTWPASKRGPAPASTPVPVAAAAPAPKASTATNAVASTNTPATVQPAPVDRNSLETRWVSWVRAPLRDPFLLLPPPPPKAASTITPVSQLQLHGLWVQTGNSVAVINQTVYGEGDTVAGFKILRIERDKVVVQGPEKTETINFNTYVPGATTSGPRTNWVENFLGPEKENIRY